jgi:hypothetical protein
VLLGTTDFTSGAKNVLLGLLEGLWCPLENGWRSVIPSEDSPETLILIGNVGRLARLALAKAIVQQQPRQQPVIN